MNNTPDLARFRDIQDPYGFLSFSCSVCDYFPRANDVVALVEDSREILCLVCFMGRNGLIASNASKIIKMALGCEDCGFSKSAYALQFDHMDSATKYRTKSGKVIHPSDLFRTCSNRVFMDEVSKCVIRCANDHAIKTARERGLE